MKSGVKGTNFKTAVILGWLTKDRQIKANIPENDRSIFSQEKYKFLLAAPFEISNKCCNVMKKSPANEYARKTWKHPITAQMASESRLRTQKWLQNGCNGFNLSHPISNPMSFWFDFDCLLYIRTHNLPIAPVYGKIVTDDEESGQMNLEDLCGLEIFDKNNVELHTTGCTRTGCVFCGFGLQCDKRPNRFEQIDRVSNPNLRDYCMRGGAFDADGLWKPTNEGLGYWFVMNWIKIAGNFTNDVLYVPEYERYEREYGNERTREELEIAREIASQ